MAEPDAVVGKFQGLDTVDVETSRHKIYRNRFTVGKICEGAVQTVNNAGIGDADRMKRNILTGMESVLGDQGTNTLLDVSRRMSATGANGATSCFSGGTLAIGDVTTLAASPEPPQQPGGKASGSLASGGSFSELPDAPMADANKENQAPPDVQTENWENLDSVAAKEARAQKKWETTAEFNVTKRITEADALISDAGGQKDSAMCKHEFAILENTLKALKGVNSERGVSMTELQQAWEAHSQPADRKAKVEQNGDGASVAGDGSALGKRPPCRDFKSLITLTTYKDQIDELYFCESREAINDIVETLKPSKAAISALLTIIKQNITDASKALGNAKQAVIEAPKELVAVGGGQGHAVPPIKRLRGLGYFLFLHSEL